MGLEVDIQTNPPNSLLLWVGDPMGFIWRGQWLSRFHYFVRGGTFQCFTEIPLYKGRYRIRIPIEEHEPLPLQKRIAVICVLHIYCAQHNTHAECTCAKCAQIAHMYTKYVLLAFVLYVYIL